MVIGDKRYEVIENIRIATNMSDFHSSVEVSDPTPTAEEKKEIINRYTATHGKLSYKIKRFFAERMADIATGMFMGDAEVEGLENARDIDGGAIITLNHFNPIDSTAARRVVSMLGGGKLNIVSRESNFAMNGFLGYLMNYARTIPITDDPHYMARFFAPKVSEMLARGEYVLIYPEAQMWFNYRKPRPLMEGAYHYAAKNMAPVLPVFVEMRDTGVWDNEDFLKVKYKIHVLSPIYPDANKTLRENVAQMCRLDYEEKREAYEIAYGKKLDYTFSDEDIAGFIVAQDPYMAELFGGAF